MKQTGTHINKRIKWSKSALWDNREGAGGVPVIILMQTCDCVIQG